MRLAAALVILLSLVALLPAHPASGGTGTPTFRMSSTGGSGVELNLGVLPDGHIFVGTWNGPVKSTDDGLTWHNVYDLPANVAADRTLTVDKQTGRVFFDDTYLGCTLLAFSDNEGGTWLRNPVACGASATDHEKIAVGPLTSTFAPLAPLYGNAVYVCANGLVDDACGVSFDGGLTFTTGEPHGIGCAFQGQPHADASGILYEGADACGAQIRTSANNGLTWSATAVPVSAASDTGEVPDIATTPDGTVYFLYADTSYHAKYVVSHNHGASWSAPVDVTPSGVTSIEFPVIVGGDDGRIGVAFYGTTDASMSGKDPGSAGTGVAWNGYVGVVTDADTATPTIQVVQATPAGDPLHYGCISKDAGCGGDPIADYMDLDVGPDGRLYAAFMDACPPGCTSHAQTTAAVAEVAVQTGGTNLKP
jgi:hypothetical protein